MEFLDWLKKEKFKKEEIENIYNEILSYDNSMASVDVGYVNSESVADGFFKNEYPIEAHITKYKEVFILWFTEEMGIDTEFKVFNTEEEAIKVLYEKEDSLEVSINKQLENFKEEIDELIYRIDIDVKREYNNSGNYYSFNIYLDDNLLIDGCFGLDSEEVIKEVNEIDELKENLKSEYDINLDKISKHKNNFERYYDIELSNDSGSTTIEIHINGTTQGKTKKLKDYIEELNIEDILEEFE